MKIETYCPDQYLSSLIKCYWTLEGTTTFHTEKLLPKCEPQILFHLNEPFFENSNIGLHKQPYCLISGQITNYKEIVSKGRAELFGVVFHPHTLINFFNIPAYELTNSSIDLCIINRKFKQLHNKILHSKNTPEKIQVIEQFLKKHFHIVNSHHSKIVYDYIQKIETDNFFLTPNNISDYYGISTRHLERMFKNHVGISALEFYKISRFNKSFKLLSASMSLTEIAYETGHYDQSYFTKCFKRMSGLSPKQYRKLISSTCR